MQKAKFFMEYLRVTQGYGFNLDGTVKKTYSHTGSWALDLGGKDTGSDAIYCPCDMAVKRVRLQANGEIYLESTAPVLFADGTSDYLSMLLVHGDNRHLKAGQILQLGDYVTSEGGYGGGNPNMFAKHIHVEAKKGKWKSTTQFPNAYGVYIIEDQAPLHELFILGQDVEILDGGGYLWDVDKFIPAPPEPTPVPETSAIWGIDVAKYQGSIDWLKVKNSGVKYALLKCVSTNEKGQLYVDDYFEYNYSECKRLGIPVGAYLYTYAFNTAEADLELDLLFKTLKNKSFEYPIVVDFEDKLLYNKGKDHNGQLALYMCEQLKTNGYYPMFYSYSYFCNSYINMSYLEDIDVWLADYVAEVREDVSYKGDHTIWQYTSDGTVSGINARCDLNYCYKDYGFIKEQGLNGFGETPESETKTEIFEDKPDGSFIALYNINVRSAPSTEFEKIGMFAEGDVVEHYEDDGEWSRVKIDGVYGWIKSEPYAKEIA